ncbi:MAG: F0F1 ATP synthase subunit B [Reichenbachiella sp.]|uniref:F0F1 ATP synthase subunit B n=2 Tax=Reichenbachiella sp. TaxID=2184521 RepID=UPI002966C5FB|nr:F0F1 ATP synthase subunit B [Reichenbachiella sp.]MDW3208806.1 F0F1 ATP synthase subunit B [Reichenbachiella sp.]
MELVTPGIGLIIWQTIVFLAVFGILAAFVWRPITDALRTRESFIQDSLDAAENAKKKIEELKQDNEYLLEEARLERDKMIKDATEIANKIKEDAKDETSKITAKMIEDAKSVINTEKNAALADVKNLVAELSLDIAEKLLKGSLADKKAQETLVKDLVKDIKVN